MLKQIVFIWDEFLLPDWKRLKHRFSFEREVIRFYRGFREIRNEQTQVCHNRMMYCLGFEICS